MHIRRSVSLSEGLMDPHRTTWQWSLERVQRYVHCQSEVFKAWYVKQVTGLRCITRALCWHRSTC